MGIDADQVSVCPAKRDEQDVLGTGVKSGGLGVRVGREVQTMDAPVGQQQIPVGAAVNRRRLVAWFERMSNPGTQVRSDVLSGGELAPYGGEGTAIDAREVASEKLA